MATCIALRRAGEHLPSVPPFNSPSPGRLHRLELRWHKALIGVYPYSGLTLGTDGNFYGTTYEGGSSGAGTVFKVTTSGKITTLHSFDGFNCCAYAAPIQGLDGNYYGTTSDGGGEVFGTVYRITPSGKLTEIYTFPGTSGLAYPQAVTLGSRRQLLRHSFRRRRKEIRRRVQDHAEWQTHCALQLRRHTRRANSQGCDHSSQ